MRRPTTVEDLYGDPGIAFYRSQIRRSYEIGRLGAVEYMLAQARVAYPDVDFVPEEREDGSTVFVARLVRP